MKAQKDKKDKKNKKITFILGGARSGKSSFALEEALKLEGGKSKKKTKKAFIATLDPLDEEMAARVEAHRRERGDGWDVFEEPVDVARLFADKLRDYDIILMDCLTLWLSNLMLRHMDVEEGTAGLIKAIRDSEARIFMVSNEVGMGIVPDSPLGRAFRDEAGRLNRKIAGVAGMVYLVTAGIPIKIKGEDGEKKNA